MNTDCVVYRCGKQDEMYLYLRAGKKPEELPEALLRCTGTLTQVMALSLAPGRKLARVDVDKVLEKLQEPGYYLQMPPQGHLKGNLYFGD
jgi:uncharacterized protein YcgL (UPF0745 family)